MPRAVGERIDTHYGDSGRVVEQKITGGVIVYLDSYGILRACWESDLVGLKRGMTLKRPSVETVPKKWQEWIDDAPDKSKLPDPAEGGAPW